jgi:long-chain acyl-CoA synthetase
MISHENIIVSIIGAVLTLPVGAADEQVCFLPLCHILERLISVFTPIGEIDGQFRREPGDRLRQCARGQRRILHRRAARLGKGLQPHHDHGGRGDAARQMGLSQAGGQEPAKSGGDGERRSGAAGTALAYAFWDFMVLRNLRRMLGIDRLRRGVWRGADLARPAQMVPG